jgi:hypothetical protein
MRYPNYPGVGKRIVTRLKALGYVTPSGGPDIARFIREKHYDPRSFYPWTKDRTPQGENLIRLASDLGCSPAYLLFGTEMPQPIGGGSAVASTAPAADSLPLAHPWDLLPLIGRWLRRLATTWAQPLLPDIAYA